MRMTQYYDDHDTAVSLKHSSSLSTVNTTSETMSSLSTSIKENN